MKFFKAIFFCITLSLIFSTVLNANKIGILQQEQEGLVYKKARSYGLLLHGNGLGLNVDFVNMIDYYKRKFYRFELVTMKHPKEFKEAAFLNRNRPYAYGKINSFYNIQASRGQMNLLADKGRKNGVEISWLYAYGVALGIAKPYYLLDCNKSDFCSERVPVKYSPETADTFLDPPQRGQVSKAPGTLGWSEVKIYPGLHAKLGVNIDFALFDDLIQAVEFGVKVNAYAKRIPILVGDNNRFIFPNVYIKASVGKRIY